MAAAAARVFRGCRFLMSPAASSAAGGKRPASASAAAAAGVGKVTKADAAEAKEKRGIMRPVPVSDALRRFAGVPEISRAGAVKLIWNHIKANGLQNPANKKEINCDEKLKVLFAGRDKIGSFSASKPSTEEMMYPLRQDRR
uniref:DM2 domain-containing protein n=1 Tax=Leersia perrieri TaxID=77586 RepID=A0A0D9VBS3_9ORYZ